MLSVAISSKRDNYIGNNKSETNTKGSLHCTNLGPEDRIPNESLHCTNQGPEDCILRNDKMTCDINERAYTVPTRAR
jgi:predicted nucleic acid binding AN1-type Zn finger protein